MARGRDALARLSAANPVPELRVHTMVDRASRDALLARILREPVREAESRPEARSRTRLALLAAAIVALVAGPAYALEGRIAGWLGGEPAPPSVVENFNSYARQLRFDPEPGKAVLVAEESDVRLYATTNEQATYCIALSTRFDGGMCVSPAIAAAPTVAGVLGDAPPRGHEQRLVLVGRIQDSRVRTVRFAAPGGGAITRSVGVGGFFVATVPADGVIAACAADGWTPTFSFAGADGRVVNEAAITVAVGSGPGGGRVCSYGVLSAP